MPLRVPLVPTPAARLQISIPLHLHVYTPASHLQSSGAPYLYTSTFPGPQHASPSSRSLEAKRQHACGASPDLLRQPPPRPYIPAARVQSSRAPYLYTSTSTRLQRASRPPELRSSIPLHLHVTRPTACLPSSRSPYLLGATRLQRTPRALEANTSTSPGPQHGARGTRSLVTSRECLSKN